MIARFAKALFRWAAVRSLIPPRAFDWLLAYPAAQSLDPENPYVERLLGRPGHRTWLARLAVVSGSLGALVLGALWLIASLEYTEFSYLWPGWPKLGKVAWLSFWILVIASMVIAPIVGDFSFHSLKDSHCSKLRKKGWGLGYSLAAIHGAILLWTAFAARMSLCAGLLAVMFVWQSVMIKTSLTGAMPPKIIWHTFFISLFVALMFMANWITGFYMRATYAAVRRSKEPASLLWCFLGFCLRAVIYTSHNLDMPP